MHEQLLQHVLVPADVCAVQSSGFVEMRAGSLDRSRFRLPMGMGEMEYAISIVSIPVGGKWV